MHTCLPPNQWKDLTHVFSKEQTLLEQTLFEHILYDLKTQDRVSHSKDKIKKFLYDYSFSCFYLQK